MIKTFTAWAIDSQSTEGHGLLGRYYFTQQIPPSLEGGRLSLFKTRKIAKEHLKKLKEGWVSEYWNPKVVKVYVTVSTKP